MQENGNNIYNDYVILEKKRDDNFRSDASFRVSNYITIR